MPDLRSVKSSVRSLAARQLLFRRGDPSSRIFFLEKGRVRLQRHTEDGRLVTLHTAAGGQWLAEASLFSEHYHCDAVALRPSTVRQFPAAAVHDAMIGEPTTARVWLGYLAKQLQSARFRLELRGIRQAHRRVLLYLDHLADADPPDSLARRSARFRLRTRPVP